MKVETISNGTRLVKRYRSGRCYAAVWSADTTDKQVESQIRQGEGCFYPYDEGSGEFLWHLAKSPLRFRR